MVLSEENRNRVFEILVEMAKQRKIQQDATSEHALKCRPAGEKLRLLDEELAALLL